MVISAPGARPAVRQELVKHTDITATIYDWAGIDPPPLPVGAPDDSDTMPALHGRSLLPLLRGGHGAANDWRTDIFVQSNNSHVNISPSGWARTLRTEQYRYTRFLSDGGEQLFDLIRDPDEQVNLAHHPAHAAERDRLRDRLFEATVRDGYPNTPYGLYRLGSW